MEIGETPAETARRELQEETGLEAKIISFLGIYIHRTDYYGELLIIGYAVRITGGEFNLDDELQEAKFVEHDKLPPIPFNSHRQLIETAFTRELNTPDSK